MSGWPGTPPDRVCVRSEQLPSGDWLVCLSFEWVVDGADPSDPDVPAVYEETGTYLRTYTKPRTHQQAADLADVVWHRLVRS